MKKILIVDDQSKIRELVKVTLSGIGDYQIFEADTGRSAIEIAQKEKPNMVFLDIMLPYEIDGLEVTRTLKNNPQTKDIVIVLLTAKGQRLDMKQGLEAGADDYFVKPFNPTDLIKKVESVLG